MIQIKVPQLSRRSAWVLGAISVVLALFVGYTAAVLVSGASTPGDNSAEAGFARDMTNHHAQAVELGMIAYQRATLPDVRDLGADIALTQQGQIGVMSQWLKDWNLNVNSTARPMAWMDQSIPAGQLMPGMANADEMTKLRNATGKQVDILFCQYMVRHHLGGIHMVDGVLARAYDQDVIDLATSMKNGQLKEIDALKQLLTRLGAAPLPA